MFAGALLSRLLRIPLVLEYNASEDWMAKHWDPVRFGPWLRLCEKVSVRAASFIAVVSNPLKQELLEAGVPEARILVNPNAVDPDWFHPGCGGERVRQELGLLPSDIIVGFVGTFSYWHGVAVLEQAIRALLDNARGQGGQLKFLLVGDALRNEDEEAALKSVRAYLDAADILVSPHVPMPGGGPFFGSPTKLFEYMAMGKAIVASALNQIADVLEHGRTALLVKPGEAGELAEAIQRLALDAQLRAELGRNAREAVLARHTWRQNARRVLSYSRDGRRAPTEPLGSAVAVHPSPPPSTNLSQQDI